MNKSRSKSKDKSLVICASLLVAIFAVFGVLSMFSDKNEQYSVSQVQ